MNGRRIAGRSARLTVWPWRVLVFGAVSLLAQGCTPVTPEQVFSVASRSVVMVYSADAQQKIVGRGSGVALTRNVFVTCCHVIARGRIVLLGHRQERLPARLVAYDAQRDLCLLAAAGLDVEPARPGDAARIGQRVYAVGTPEGFELTLSEGLVSGLREAAAGRYIQITAPLSEGSSGGGLFDAEGRLTGITAFVFSAGQNLNFAAPVQWAADLLQRMPALDEAPAVELPPALATQWRPPMLR